MGYGQYSGHSFARRQERGKHLAGYAECIEAWLRGETSGKAGGGRMYFRGATLWSYGEHYPMAHIIAQSAGCLVNCESNSATTNKHMSLVRRGVSSRFSSDVVFYLPTHVIKALIDGHGSLKSHASAFDYYGSLAKTSFERSLSKRVREDNREQAASAAMEHMKTANRYADFYGLQRPFKTDGAPEAVQFAFALGDHSALVAYLVKEIA